MPVYEYDYEFDQAEVVATTWERKKIQFVNKLAIDWGGEIKERAEGMCFAPVDSTALADIARCQSLNFDTINAMESAIK